MACCFTQQLLHSLRLYIIGTDEKCVRSNELWVETLLLEIWTNYFRTHYVVQHFSSLPVQNLNVSSPTIYLLTLVHQICGRAASCLRECMNTNCMNVLHEVSISNGSIYPSTCGKYQTSNIKHTCDISIIP